MMSTILLSTCIASLISAIVAWRVGAATLSTRAMRGAPASRPHKTVQAEQFLLTDQSGRICAGLSTRDGAPQLVFFDAKGRTRASLMIQADGGPALLFMDGDENPRTSLVLDAQSIPKFALSTMDGKEQVVLTGRQNGSALLLCDRDGRHRVGLIAGDYGLSCLSLFDGKSTNRATLSVISEGISSFVLMNETGHVVWQAP